MLRPLPRGRPPVPPLPGLPSLLPKPPGGLRPPPGIPAAVRGPAAGRYHRRAIRRRPRRACRRRRERCRRQPAFRCRRGRHRAWRCHPRGGPRNRSRDPGSGPAFCFGHRRPVLGGDSRLAARIQIRRMPWIPRRSSASTGRWPSPPERSRTEWRAKKPENCAGTRGTRDHRFDLIRLLGGATPASGDTRPESGRHQLTRIKSANRVPSS